jgi:hypothetical protein
MRSAARPVSTDPGNQTLTVDFRPMYISRTAKAGNARWRFGSTDVRSGYGFPKAFPKTLSFLVNL